MHKIRDMNVVAACAVSLLAYAILESAWLVAMHAFYEGQFARIGVAPLKVHSYLAAVWCYALLLVGFYVLVLSVPCATPVEKMLRGCVYGKCVYGVYNLTNKATVPGWSWMMVILDTAWGALAFGATAWVFTLASSSS